MTRFVASIVLAALLAACGNEVAGPPSSSSDEGAPAGITTAPSSSASIRGDGTADDGVTPPADDGSDDAPPPADDGSDDAPPPADDVTPPPAADEPVTPPPVDVSQTCSEWQDCGPHFGDLNSGFDCDGGQCACNVAGDHDDACRAIGGYWSDLECFCFVTSSRPPATDDTENVTCWWSWHEECDADVWVDTSYYRRECDSSGRCRDVYVRRGYWRDGYCDDIWTRNCSDGTSEEYP